MQVLKMLQAGQITVEDAAKLLSALTPATEESAEEPIDRPPAPPAPPTEDRWSRFWIYPLMAGGGVLLLGAMVMGLVNITGAARGWLVCGWLPMILGAIVVLLAFWTRRAKWLHLRVQEKGGRRIAISLPLPLTLTAWLLRIAQPFVPQLKDTGVDDLIIALRDNPRGEPISIDVKDGRDGEQVQLYFG
jgi:hypothetical protein